MRAGVALFRIAPFVAAGALSLASCVGTTGYELVSFYAAAQGVARGAPGQPYAFTNDQGYDVTLTQATLLVGAVYLNQTVPTSGEGEEPCTLPGTYVGEVRGKVTIDLLSASLQPFSVTGEGTTIPAALGQVWLTGDGNVNDQEDPTTLLTVVGTARKAGMAYPFGGQVSIDASCFAPPSTTMPGMNPICQDRIVTPILTHIVLEQSGTLVLTVDVARMFSLIDFSMLPRVMNSNPPTYGFTGCAGDDIPSQELFTNLLTTAPYSFAWRAKGS